ncbi:hypothetical protein Tco_0409465 [Tanacetum coccineum]
MGMEFDSRSTSVQSWLSMVDSHDHKEQSACITRGYNACIIVAYSSLLRARIPIQSFASPLVVPFLLQTIVNGVARKAVLICFFM